MHKRPKEFKIETANRRISRHTVLARRTETHEYLADIHRTLRASRIPVGELCLEIDLANCECIMQCIKLLCAVLKGDKVVFNPRVRLWPGDCMQYLDCEIEHSGLAKAHFAEVHIQNGHCVEIGDIHGHFLLVGCKEQGAGQAAAGNTLTLSIEGWRTRDADMPRMIPEYITIDRLIIYYSHVQSNNRCCIIHRDTEHLNIYYSYCVEILESIIIDRFIELWRHALHSIAVKFEMNIYITRGQQYTQMVIDKQAANAAAMGQQQAYAVNVRMAYCITERELETIMTWITRMIEKLNMADRPVIIRIESIEHTDQKIQEQVYQLVDTAQQQLETRTDKVNLKNMQWYIGGREYTPKTGVRKKRKRLRSRRQ